MTDRGKKILKFEYFNKKKSFFSEIKSIFHNYLKHVSTIFYQIFIFHKMIALSKLWKMFLISTKKLFSLSRYSVFCVSVFHSFSPCQPLLQGLIKDKSWNLWRRQLSEEERILLNILRRKKGKTLKLCPSIEY